MIKINPYSFPSLYNYVDNQNQTIDDYFRAGRIHTTAPAVVTAPKSTTSNFDPLKKILSIPINIGRGIIAGELQKKQAIQNGINDIKENIKNKEYTKAFLNLAGIPNDALSSAFLGIPMQFSPHYTMPLKDIGTTIYNRIARRITKDNNFTATKGHIYTNIDISPEVNKIAKQVAFSAINNNDGGIKEINHQIKSTINSKLSYGASSLLKHPFNPTAGYAWSIGRINPIILNQSVNITDPYDNDIRKTQYYLNKSKPLFTDLMRGYAGLLTSYSTEPDNQKQTFHLNYNLNQ